MSVKTLIRWFLIVALFLMVSLVLGLRSVSPVMAQCENPPKSSCISCHGRVDHLAGMGEWNGVHVSQDMCTSCHGGNGSTMDKDLAHEGIVAQPLSDIYTDCHSCHPTNYVARSAQFAATLHVTPGSCATPTPVALINNSGGLPPGSIIMPSDQAKGHSLWGSFLMATGGLATLAFFLLGLWWLERHQVID
jgi:hypothetical protein